MSVKRGKVYMRTRVLSIENALCWSWGVNVKRLRQLLSGKYKVVRICRKIKEKIDPVLLKAYPLILAQNIDNITLIDECRDKVILRIGGMVINNKSSKSRYNNHIEQVSAVIATNRQLYEIGKAANENTFLVPNGVDLDVFKPAKERPDRKFTLGFAGNIWGVGGNYKGWQFYVAATLSLFGQVSKLEKLHNGPNVQQQIDHGKMPEEFYHKIDCLILPSLGEGCSNVVGEALACGVPVLLTKVGYHGEMLKHRENCLFIKRNVQDIVNKIKMLKDNPELYAKISANSRKFVEEHQNIRDIAKCYDEVFQSVLYKSKV